MTMKKKVMKSMLPTDVTRGSSSLCDPGHTFHDTGPRRPSSRGLGELRQKLEEIVDLDESVVVVVRIAGRGGGSGVPVSQELAVVRTFEGDKAVRAWSFTSRAKPSKPPR